MFRTCRLAFLVLGAQGFSLNLKDETEAYCNILPGQYIGEITDPPIKEASGLAVSRMNPYTLYTHPDSDHGNHVFAIAPTGEVKAQIVLDGCSNHDWEDIEVTGSHIYVADTGNNGYSRDNLRVLRFSEPYLDGSTNLITIPRAQVDYLDFYYPPGYTFDCEALAVDPITHDIFLFTKDWVNYQSNVFRYPWALREEGKSMMLEYITTLPLLTVTGADISPTGNTLAITNLWEGFSYTKPAGVSWGDYLKTQQNSYCKLAFNQLPQMEAIAVTEEGYLSTTENCKKCPIWYYAKY